jgi:hypothetical protein
MTLKPAAQLGAILALALSGCATPAVTESHADPATRMLAVAQRFDQDRRTAGMIDDIGKCYARASALVIEIYALRDCLVLDYVAYRTDVTIGRRIDGGPLPFFTDQAFAARAGRYAQMDQGDDPNQRHRRRRSACDDARWPHGVYGFLGGRQVCMERDLQRL